MPLARLLAAGALWEPATVAVTAINTSDAAPASSPFRVGAGGQATVTFTVAEPGPVNAYRMRKGGTGSTSGTEVAGVGAICGVSTCGMHGPAAIPAPATITTTVTAAELATEGDHQINLYVWSAGVLV